MYDVNLAIKACLEREGYPGPKPPSRQKFIDAGEGNDWDPFSAISMRTLGKEKYYALFEKCPPFNAFMLEDGYPVK